MPIEEVDQQFLPIQVGELFPLKVRLVAKEKGMSMGRLSRTADLEYNTMKRFFDDPHHSPTLETLVKVAKGTSAGQSHLNFEEVVK